MNERDAYIALNRMEGVGPVAVRALVEGLGSAQAVFEAESGDLRRCNGIGPRTAKAIHEQRADRQWEADVEECERRGARIITQIDEEYPSALLEIHDPPLALYVLGSFTQGDANAIAVVGTRRPTHYGRECAESLSYRLAGAGFTVVSGLAEGIDTSAHRGALKARGRTIAVLGSALDCLYPPSNEALAEEIREHGAVLSEFPFGRVPDKTTFPMRNRIVSGLSTGVLVVEAGLRSGALITADQALEQGRHVFAVPGRIDSFASKGTHALIRKGARLTTGIDDILEEYEFLFARSGKETAGAAPTPALSEDEARLMGVLEEGHENVDELIRATGLGPGAVSSALISLEMKRMVRMQPGRRVERLRSPL